MSNVEVKRHRMIAMQQSYQEHGLQYDKAKGRDIQHKKKCQQSHYHHIWIDHLKTNYLVASIFVFGEYAIKIIAKNSRVIVSMLPIINLMLDFYKIVAKKRTFILSSHVCFDQTSTSGSFFFFFFFHYSSLFLALFVLFSFRFLFSCLLTVGPLWTRRCSLSDAQLLNFTVYNSG